MKLEPGSELDGSEHPQAVVGKTGRIDDAEDSAVDVASPVERIFVLAGQGIPGNGVDREVAAAGGVCNRQVRVAHDVEAAMASAGLRLTARQRHVEIAELVNLKAFADRLYPAKCFEDLAQARGVNSVDLQVDILGVAAEEAIADPASNNQRPSAGVANGDSNRLSIVGIHNGRFQSLLWRRPLGLRTLG